MSDAVYAFQSAAVAQRFALYPPSVRTKMMAVRALIFSTAARTPGVGVLEETLKWGEPAYLTIASRSGSTIRIDWKPATPLQHGIYFNCQTTLVDTFRTLFPRDFRFDGNRALLLDLSQPMPSQELAFCIEAALTYKLRRGRNKGASHIRNGLA